MTVWIFGIVAAQVRKILQNAHRRTCTPVSLDQDCLRMPEVKPQAKVITLSSELAGARLLLETPDPRKMASLPVA